MANNVASMYTIRNPIRIFTAKLFPKLGDLKKDFHCNEANFLNIGGSVNGSWHECQKYDVCYSVCLFFWFSILYRCVNA